MAQARSSAIQPPAEAKLTLASCGPSKKEIKTIWREEPTCFHSQSRISFNGTTAVCSWVNILLGNQLWPTNTGISASIVSAGMRKCQTAITRVSNAWRHWTSDFRPPNNWVHIARSNNCPTLERSILTFSDLKFVRIDGNVQLVGRVIDWIVWKRNNILPWSDKHGHSP